MMEVPESDLYWTLKGEGEGFYKEKGSKFLAFAYPVTSAEEIKACQEALRKQYYDARHHCYAWRLGPAGERLRANDDGEPNHSAGDPILGQLKSADLTDALVIVIRYFGGTKLGVSGLIHAYRTAAAEALEKAPRIQKTVSTPLHLRYPYDRTQEVMRLVDEYPVAMTGQEFAADCQMTLEVPRSLHARVQEAVEKIPDVAVLD